MLKLKKYAIKVEKKNDFYAERPFGQRNYFYEDINGYIEFELPSNWKLKYDVDSLRDLIYDESNEIFQKEEDSKNKLEWKVTINNNNIARATVNEN